MGVSWESELIQSSEITICIQTEIDLADQKSRTITVWVRLGRDPLRGKLSEKFIKAPTYPKLRGEDRLGQMIQ